MTANQSSPFAWALASAVVVGVGVVLRLHNAFDYPIGKGFDAVANWEYVALLLERFTLPDPASLWATSHPPLFYWLASGIGAPFGLGEPEALVPWVRLAGSAAGLVAIAWGWRVVRALDPEPRRLFFIVAA